MRKVNTGIFLAITFILSLLFAGCDTMAIDYAPKDIINLYNKAPEKFAAVAEYVIKNNIYTNKTYEGKLEFKKDGKEITIDDKNVYDNMVYILKNLKFVSISKAENSINFIRESTLGNAVGIARSIDGKEPKEEAYTVTSEKIKDNWYYFKWSERDK